MRKRLYALKDNVWFNIALIWGFVFLMGLYVLLGKECIAKYYVVDWVYRMMWGIMGLFITIRVIKS